MTSSSNNEIGVFLTHSNKDNERVLVSESGKFYIDGKGIVQRFEPSEDNPFVDEETVKEANYTFKTNKSIRTFIVPKGVKGFVSNFMRGVEVKERFELPEGLLSLGSYDDRNHDLHCIFADCILPAVVIPESMKGIGSYAFGHSYIDSLQLPESLHSPYGRQFKDSYIGTLILPKEWKDGVSLGKYGELHLNGWWFDNDKYGYLRWPSTKIENLEFY